MHRAHPTTRRGFLQSASAAAAATLIPIRVSRAAGSAAAAGQNLDIGRIEYSFPMLGDIHYDQWAHHDMDWVKKEKPNDIRQIENYVEVSNEFTPRLLNLTRRLIADSNSPVPFAVQIGDFVEGLCGSYELQALQSREAIELVEGTNLGAPMLMTKGNHDITGPGADQAFDDVLLPWMAKQAGRKLDSANYHVRHGDDLFVFFDAYKPDLDFVEQAMANEPARHRFFIVHPPVVPYNARANWHVFDRDSQKQERRRLIDLLSRHEAVVLGGHLHKYSLLERRSDVGRFTQLAVSSVIRREHYNPGQVLNGIEHYTPETLLDLNPDFSPSSRDDRRAWVEREQPHISRFHYARTAGLAMVHVGTHGVAGTIYNGLEREPWREQVIAPAKAQVSAMTR